VFEFLRTRVFSTVITWNYRADDHVLYAGFDNRRAARRTEGRRPLATHESA
jgi:hypothetical protein